MEARGPRKAPRQAPAPALLRASTSRTWTMHGDRSQDAPAKALNLIRNRKGGWQRAELAEAPQTRQLGFNDALAKLCHTHASWLRFLGQL